MHVRSLFAVALAAILATPLAASAQAKKGTTTKAQPARAAPAASTAPASKALAVGGWVGYEWGDADGFQLRVDGEMPFQKLTPQIDLSFVGSLGYTRASYDVFGADLTVSRFKVVPAARFTFPVNPQISLFGDAGIGFHYTKVTIDYTAFGLGDVSDSEFSFMLRIGGGGFYHVNPRTRIGASVMIDPMFGDYDDTTFALLVGLMYQL
jgi:opacity protein-like surface antigen